MPSAINTFVPDFEYSRDKVKRNTGGLSQSDTLIEQGDNPVNIVDIEAYNQVDIEMRSEYPDMYDGDSDYVQQKRSDGDINEGVSMCRTMFKDTIRKNSDY